MTDAGAYADYAEELFEVSPRVAAAAIRDAIEALQSERPDLAAQLQALLDRIEPAG